MTTGDSHDRHLEEAMDWLMRLRDAPADRALQAQLQDWVDSDPAHARAWERARMTWQIMSEVPPATAESWQAGGPAEHRGRRVVRRVPVRRGWLALTALAACLLLLLGPTAYLHLNADHVTRTAELQRVTLADGSVVHLAPKSAIKAGFTEGQRHVELLAGEAFFEVVPNPDRPFTVKAEGLDVIVLGTSFDVRLAAQSLTVGVRSGQVGVRYDRGDPPLDAQLGPGERVIVERASATATRDKRPPDQIAAWRDHHLFVSNATVADVVEELRRYHNGWIVIADDLLAHERVTGLYDLRDPDRALRALVEPAGGQVRSMTPLLRVLSRP
jgi:transmembrane sensor